MTEKLIELITNTGLIFFWIVLIILISFMIFGAVIGVICFFRNYWKSIWNKENEHDGE